VRGTFPAIVVPRAGDKPDVIVFSDHVPFTKLTLKFPAVVIELANNFRLAFAMLALV
jgi:hypothetical protein